MKKLFYISWLCLTFVTCSKAELPNLSGTPASLTLSINTMQNDVKTRAVSPDFAERRIFNFYVFVFNKDGAIDYQKFHNLENSVVQTYKLSIEGLTCGSGKSVTVIANLEELNSIIDLKKEVLDKITTRKELDELIVDMQYEAIERATSFLSSCTVNDVTVSADGAIDVAMPLVRVDAKICFNVTTAAGVTFTPTDWRVVSLPRRISVMGERLDLCSEEIDCFNSKWSKFEDGGATFAFYSMEHLLTPKSQIPITGNGADYALREAQEKNEIGGGRVDNGEFIYAPKMGTYVEMRGNVKYKIDGGDREISADVVYAVHFGGIDGVNDYNTRRNTFYTYNVKIVSVSKIEVEVEDGDELRPGAEGDVTAALEIMDLDAHNETFTLELTKSMVDETLTWNVSTPFSKGSEKDAPTDYKWIYFRISNKDNNKLGYIKDFRTYPGKQAVYTEINLDKYIADIAAGTDQLLDVKQLVALLVESKDRSNKGGTHLFDSYNNVKFTAFVNEYYYETSPNDETITADTGFWKKFVNEQSRVMNILSDLKYSPDHESSKSNAVYSIRQHSIQTMFNRSLEENFTAWGLQLIQDIDPVVFDKGDYSAWGHVNNAEHKSNGRKNMIGLLNLVNGSDANSDKWDRFITPANWLMKTDYDAAKYKCLRMNRDTDGDNIVDEDEVQWYLAAINQLTDIWIGEWSYDPAARLFKNTTWVEQYFVSSTVASSVASSILRQKDNPYILWSSEGSSTGVLTGNHSGSVNQPVYYRCVRNLGVPRTADKDIEPNNLVVYDSNSHIMSLRRLDEQSIRATYQTTQELPVHHEREASNKPYWDFEVATTVQGGNYTWKTLYEFIQGGGRLCPKDFRVPNQRELALMLSRIGNDGHWTLNNHFSRTGFKFYKIDGGDEFNRPGFSVSTNSEVLFLTHGNVNETGGVRCVKDVVKKSM